jgi:hypothetical protein
LEFIWRVPAISAIIFIHTVPANWLWPSVGQPMGLEWAWVLEPWRSGKGPDSWCTLGYFLETVLLRYQWCIINHT